jgi:DNA-binding protein YbaB
METVAPLGHSDPMIGRVSDAEQFLQQQTARVEGLRHEADAAMSSLHARIAQARQAQADAMQVTGQATSRDGSVRVSVDATGVVTSLNLSPSAFDRNTPDKLAQAIVATLQSAAAQARGQLRTAFSEVRAGSGDVLAAADAGAAELGVPRMSVPEVPRTADDPTGQFADWEPTTPPAASKPRRTGHDDEPDNFSWDERPW